jgi:4-amino-4-deoxy-L-arabinose transferase-like glycosyltransferase
VDPLQQKAGGEEPLGPETDEEPGIDVHGNTSVRGEMLPTSLSADDTIRRDPRKRTAWIVRRGRGQVKERRRIVLDRRAPHPKDGFIMIGPTAGGTARHSVGDWVTARQRLLLPAGLLLIGLCYLNGLDSTASYHIDESYYLVSGLTMVETGTYLYPVYEGRPRFQKPILPYWAVSIAYLLLGPGLAAARAPSLVAALLTILLTYRLGCLLWGSRPAALLSALALAANVMFFTFARLSLTDMLLTLMMTAALHFFARWFFEEPRRRVFRTLAVLSMAVAVMVKGPLGLIIPLGTISLFLAWRHGRTAPSLLVGLFSPGSLLLFLLVTLPWPLAMYHRFGDAFLAHVLLRETVDRVGITASSLAWNALRYGWALARYLFPWWLALLPLLFGAARRDGGGAGDDDGGRAQFLWFNIFTVLFLLLFALKTYSFKYLLPLTPAFSLLVGRQLAGCGGATRSPGQPLRAFHRGAAFLMAGVGLAGFALFLAGLRFPEFRGLWPLLLAAISLAGILQAARLRSQGRNDRAAGAVAGTMLLQLSLVAGTILPLLRPDAVSSLGKAHLRPVLRREDRIETVGLDEKKRAWLSIAAARVAAPHLGGPPTARSAESPPMPVAGRTYLVVTEEESGAFLNDARQRYGLVASAQEYRRTSPGRLLQGLRRQTTVEIPKRTFCLLADHAPPVPSPGRPGP